MTRKDYELIAGVIRSVLADTPDDERYESVVDVAVPLAEALAQDNDRFDRERFLIACGVRP